MKNKSKKDTMLVIRINSDKKNKFSEFCKNNQTNTSKKINQFIDNTIKK